MLLRMLLLLLLLGRVARHLWRRWRLLRVRLHCLGMKGSYDMDKPRRGAPQDAIHFEALIVQRVHIVTLHFDDLLDERCRRILDGETPLHDASREARGPGVVAPRAIGLLVPQGVLVDRLIELA